MGARAPWNSALLGPLFLTSGASAGAAFLLLFPLGESERHELSKWDRLAIMVEVALIALYLVGLLNGSAQAQAGAQLLLGGRYTAQFWSLVVVAGLAVPWFLEFFEARKHIRPTLAAPALVLLGGLALRWILVAAGQA
jgi:formate-dependent nitrite reductase membrane component NrfD